ncbi:unnamed protein product [Vicia faba]|uniref:Uncharacterized protein n=1 Tax=Vicia faba TaxID=3906 RepID=A0AAV1A7G0_VICFA|nr:unnamed protein product [Vicia faba]
MKFLDSLSPQWSISLFHYCAHGETGANGIVGIQVPSNEMDELHDSVNKLGFVFRFEVQGKCNAEKTCNKYFWRKMLIYINHLFEYVCLINEMVSANKCSLEIDYKKYIYVYPNIAIWLADAPHSVLEVMENVAKT